MMGRCALSTTLSPGEKQVYTTQPNYSDGSRTPKTGTPSPRTGAPSLEKKIGLRGGVPGTFFNQPIKFKAERTTTFIHSSTTSQGPLETCPRLVYVHLCDLSSCLCPAGRALTSDWSVHNFVMVVYLFKGQKLLL